MNIQETGRWRECESGLLLDDLDVVPDLPDVRSGTHDPLGLFQTLLFQDELPHLLELLGFDGVLGSGGLFGVV